MLEISSLLFSWEQSEVLANGKKNPFASIKAVRWPNIWTIAPFYVSLECIWHIKIFVLKPVATQVCICSTAAFL